MIHIMDILLIKRKLIYNFSVLFVYSLGNVVVLEITKDVYVTGMDPIQIRATTSLRLGVMDVGKSTWGYGCHDIKSYLKS